MPFFNYLTKQDIAAATHVRKFETRVGERVQVLKSVANPEQSIKDSTAKFVVLGVPENLGIKANYGQGAGGGIWDLFLKWFLNIQSNDFFDGQDVLMLGNFDFANIEALIESNAHDADELVDAYRHAVVQVDEAVEPLIKLICEYNKIPIVIGGGHNNAYPLIQGAAKGIHKAGTIPLASINCISLDKCVDFRPLEGRHSGNAFSYASEDGYLQKYCVLGVAENKLTQNIWFDIVNNPFIDIITYEDIYIHEKRTFLEAVAHAATFAEDSYTGIDIDLGGVCISDPSGISVRHARQFVAYAAADTKTAFLNISRGDYETAGVRLDEIAKLVSYLVSDFIKAKE